jgi:hypothetical protein
MVLSMNIEVGRLNSWTVTQNSLLKTDFELLTIVMNFIERNTHDMK